ncbi:hypothetical protein PUN28_004193 [Cardiocondyla obscurior]|uniref:Secreted protein n=1 Tax=Cardiocondyla obscurior TaxID=286306 RepID=A0AAW2GPY7_9HYME
MSRSLVSILSLLRLLWPIFVIYFDIFYFIYVSTTNFASQVLCKKTERLVRIINDRHATCLLFSHLMHLLRPPSMFEQALKALHAVRRFSLADHSTIARSLRLDRVAAQIRFRRRL